MTSAFDWNTGKTSVMLTTGRDKRLHGFTKEGMSIAQLATRNVMRREKETGRSPGSIAGLSPTADQQMLSPAQRTRGRAR